MHFQACGRIIYNKSKAKKEIFYADFSSLVLFLYLQTVSADVFPTTLSINYVRDICLQTTFTGRKRVWTDPPFVFTSRSVVAAATSVVSR